ncbi:hypothetical protein B7463_g8301, partial [Scytalidium lignicola]
MSATTTTIPIPIPIPAKLRCHHDTSLTPAAKIRPQPTIVPSKPGVTAAATATVVDAAAVVIAPGKKMARDRKWKCRSPRIHDEKMYVKPAPSRYIYLYPSLYIALFL